MTSSRQKPKSVSETLPPPGLSGPLKVGLFFAALGLILAIVGIARGMVPFNPLSIALALLISSGMWGIVSWTVATATMDVETDIVEAEREKTQDE